MNKFKTRITFIGLVLIYFGCASLTKSQLNEVNQFGELTKAFSACPAKVVSTLVDVHTESQYFVSGIIANPDLHRRSVDSIYKFMQVSAKNDSMISLVFQITSDYGQKLVHLTEDVHSMQFDTAAQSFGCNLDGLIGKFNSIEPNHAIPTGYGGLIGDVISFGGNMYIHDKQAKGAKAFVSLGDTLIGSMAFKMEQYLNEGGSNSIKAAIIRERNNLDRNYRNYLTVDNELIKLNYKKDTIYRKDRHRKEDSLAVKDTVITGSLRAWRSSNIEADRLYLKLMMNLDADEVLRQQCLAAVKALRKAHRKLLQDLQEKKNLKEVYSELRDYGGSISNMYSSFSKIK